MKIHRGLLVFGIACSACGGGDGSKASLLGTVVRVDDASEEVLATIADAVDQRGATPDAVRGAVLTMPEGDVSIPAATPYTFTWERPTAASARHGVASGSFLWLRLDGPGMAQPVDVVALTSTSFTPDAATWAEVTSATGPVIASLVTTTCDDARIVAGPFKGGPDVSFSIAR